jgi:membrane protease YdiL (CAAX protease family)
MASESKSFISQALSDGPSLMVRVAEGTRSHVTNLTSLIEISVVFGLIMVAVWTPQGRINQIASLAAAFFTIGLTIRSRFSARELGLARPLSGAIVTLAAGALVVAVIAAIGLLTRSLGPPQALPWNRAWQYGIWALLQQFILQSFMFVRLESVLGSRRAVIVSSLLFAVAHLPSPLLMLLSLMGALFFCALFRRYRNLFPLGIVHAALGLTIAASLPDSLLHHMRVGIGYLMYHT